MAEAVLEGVKEAGGEGVMMMCTDFDVSMMDSFDAIAFGCPSMGDEVLEESEFAPVFEGCETKLSGKKTALFGSYGWGDGQWMRDWEKTCKEDGAVLVCDAVICNDAPDDEAKSDCRALGKALV
jgi:flavodoxin short chain